MSEACVTTIKVPGISPRRVVVDIDGNAALDEMQSPTGESLIRLFGLDPATAGPVRRITIPRSMRNEIADALRLMED